MKKTTRNEPDPLPSWKAGQPSGARDSILAFVHELLAYPCDNQFKTCIVSGGDRAADWAGG